MREDVQGYLERVAAVHERYRSMPAIGLGETGPVDAATGEAWDRGNVLGHVAEMVPFWVDQLRAVRAGASALGRDEPGYARRRQGIESGHKVAELELREQIDQSIGGLTAFIRELTQSDLERKASYRARSGGREMTLGSALEELVIRHLEEHADQLGDLIPQ